jgi:hypothetical protein
MVLPETHVWRIKFSSTNVGSRERERERESEREKNMKDAMMCLTTNSR